MKTKQLIFAAGLACLANTPVAAQDNWFVRPYLGISQMSDLSSDFSDIDNRSWWRVPTVWAPS